jgi:hypothetical protein
MFGSFDVRGFLKKDDALIFAGLLAQIDSFNVFGLLHMFDSVNPDVLLTYRDTLVYCGLLH